MPTSSLLSWRRLRLAATAVALAALTACKTQPPSQVERAAFGDVAVEVIAAPPAVAFERPVAGWPAGLGMGAVRGVGAVVVFPAYGFWGVGRSGGGELAIVGLAVGAVAGVVWAPVSVVGGAVTAPSPDVIDAAEPVIRRVLDDPGLWETLGTRFADAARLRSGRDLVAPSHATTILQVRLESIERGDAWNWWTFDRPFEVVVEVTVRVVRRADGHVVWEDTRKSTEADKPDVVHTYEEWAQSDGAALHEVIDAALSSLASRFADSVFEQPRKDWLGQEIDESAAPPAPQE